MAETNVQANPDVYKTSLSGLKDFYYENTSVELTLHVRDKRNESIQKLAKPFTGMLRDITNNGSNITTIITNNNDGTLTLYFIPRSPGTFELDVAYDNKGITGSPFKVFIKPTADSTSTTVSGKKIIRNFQSNERLGLFTDVIVDEMNTFIIHARDKRNGPVSGESGNFQASVIDDQQNVFNASIVEVQVNLPQKYI